MTGRVWLRVVGKGALGVVAPVEGNGPGYLVAVEADMHPGFFVVAVYRFGFPIAASFSKVIMVAWTEFEVMF